MVLLQDVKQGKINRQQISEKRNRYNEDNECRS